MPKQLYRWEGIERPYSTNDVKKLSGSVHIKYTLAQNGASKLWDKLHSLKYVSALGALTGNQAMQQAKVGLDAVYLSGWQVAGDANDSLQMYPDQSLYAVGSVPTIVKRINNTFQRADQIQIMEGNHGVDYFLPIVADAESGFGGVLNTHELVKHLIEAGSAGIHLEDQLSSAKKCGHMGGKVLVSTQEMINKLVAARLAADIMDVTIIIIARTDALSGALLQSDSDEQDHKFITGERTEEGFFKTKAGMDQAVARGIAYAPYCDMLWMETAIPDIGECKEFVQEIQKKYPNKMFAYNCSPSFNWKARLSDTEIRSFKDELGELNVKFQFITLAGFHSLNYSMFELSEKYRDTGMTGFVELQEKEFEAQERGFTAVKHQREVGASYFDQVAQVCTGSTNLSAIKGSTEEGQF
ncbi:isocitrate lyase [Marine Group I thaumarchaeote]|uniref:isocitrate lyase n=1 Tax=Marine Group I thaumarchaeote TaxID=2511932 RepID=A0A7K4MW38_9ARCH|nr:isocitrate lyase [Marine Group I thaumarchaeote]